MSTRANDRHQPLGSGFVVQIVPGAHVAVIRAAVALDRPDETPAWIDRVFDPNFPDNPHRKAPLQWVSKVASNSTGSSAWCGAATSTSCCCVWHVRDGCE